MEIVLPILVIITIIIVTVFFYLVYKQFEEVKNSLNDLGTTIRNESNKIDVKFTNTMGRSNQLHADTLKKMIVMQSLNNKKNITTQNETNEKQHDLYMGSDNESEHLPIYKHDGDNKEETDEQNIDTKKDEKKDIPVVT